MPPIDELNRVLSYCPDDGKLRWKLAVAHRVKPGDVAGYTDIHGYKKVSIGGRKFYQHRVVLAIHGVEVPVGATVDHINGERGDNRLSNLRVVSVKDNARNSSISSANKSGVTGVSWYKPLGKWRVAVVVDGRQIHGGYFDNIESAVTVVAGIRAAYGFHENHGKALKGV